MTAPQPTPELIGYTVKRDGQRWIATSSNGKYTLHGREQADLERARVNLCRELLADLQNVLDEVFPPERKLGL